MSDNLARSVRFRTRKENKQINYCGCTFDHLNLLGCALVVNSMGNSKRSLVVNIFHRNLRTPDENTSVVRNTQNSRRRKRSISNGSQFKILKPLVKCLRSANNKFVNGVIDARCRRASKTRGNSNWYVGTNRCIHVFTILSPANIGEARILSEVRRTKDVVIDSG
jgi:hypothetical protein